MARVAARLLPCRGGQGRRRLRYEVLPGSHAAPDSEGTRLCVTVTKTECYLRNKHRVKIILAKVAVLPPALCGWELTQRPPGGTAASPDACTPPRVPALCSEGCCPCQAVSLTCFVLFQFLFGALLHAKRGKQAKAKASALALSVTRWAPGREGGGGPPPLRSAALRDPRLGCRPAPPGRRAAARGCPGGRGASSPQCSGAQGYAWRGGGQLPPTPAETDCCTAGDGRGDR